MTRAPAGLQSTADWQTIPEIIDAARDAMPRRLWDGACGGSGREATLARNVAGFAELALCPRVLTGVASASTATQFLGKQITSPVVLAPVGEIALFHPDGALACAQAAATHGTGAVISVMSSPKMETVRAATAGPLALQLYYFGDASWLRRLVGRAESAGMDAICLTVDTPVSGRLDRDLHNRISLSPGPRPNLPAGKQNHYRGGSLTWADVEQLRRITSIPLILKGIMRPDDAVRAVEHGADQICISNHGGRQLDDAQSTIEVLGEIVAAIAGRARVIIDSGFLRGTDVVKALALGADTVLIGKLMVLALSAGGAAGLSRALDILAEEISITMVNLGVSEVAQLDPSYVTRAVAPPRAVWPQNH